MRLQGEKDVRRVVPFYSLTITDPCGAAVDVCINNGVGHPNGVPSHCMTGIDFPTYS